MSVGFCAHLYQPEEIFNANAFEAWYHRPSRYYADEEPDEDDEPGSCVPSYSWLDSAVAQIKERGQFRRSATVAHPAIPKEATTSRFSLVPQVARDFECCEEDLVWDSEEYNDRLELIQIITMLERMRKRPGSHSYNEVKDYLNQIQHIAGRMHKERRPSRIKPLFLGKGFLKLVK